jgi:beta-N-acetylhexosaminidase
MAKKMSREAFVESILEKMSLDDKVGQCLTFEFHGTVLTPVLRNKILNLRCGGLRATPHVHEGLPYHLRKGREGDIQRRSPWAGPAEYAQVINRLQCWAMSRKPGIPLHISMDCEGDFSNDLGKGGVNLLPSQMGLHASGDIKLAYRCWKIIARQLRAAGVNMLHSPCVDISFTPNNPTIGTRSFGDTPEVCATWGLAFMEALRSEGVISTAKHYPGLGVSRVDTHLAIDINDRPLEQLWENELYPYRKLVEGGLPAIMVAHTIFKGIDPEGAPATASRRITEFTRKELGFEGVTVTDSIAMKGLLDYFNGDLPATARAALAAGNDMILVKTTEEMEIECWKEVRKAVRQGEISRKDLDAHVRRILRMKCDHGLFEMYPVDHRKSTVPAFHPANKAAVAKAARKCCTLLSDDDHLLPLKKEQKVLVVEPYFPLYMDRGNDFYWHSSMLWEYISRYTPNVGNYEIINSGTDDDVAKILEKSRDFDVCVVISVRIGSYASSTHVAEKLLDAGRKVIVLSSSPYEYSIPAKARCVLVTYGMVPPILKNAADVLYGRRKPEGRWPLENYTSPFDHAGVKK